ncbi:MAG: pantoate--beta-alanine ligase [Chitinophagaceae bacterium]
MILFKLASQLHQYIQQQKALGKTIGFVPTMGALHKGHISLIDKSKASCNITVCSIFVNPTQFNDVKDFEKYPITIEQDIYMLEIAKCDVLFLPSVDEMYPKDFDKNKQYNLGFIETVFEGAYRPGHFNGVCMVVERLLNIVTPNKLFLGQKDYQQCIVLKRLVEIMNANIKIEICPTSREENGLAMSSRNKRLSEEMKSKAKIIYESFVNIKKEINTSNSSKLIENTKSLLLQNGFDKIDYLSLANAETLAPIEQWDGSSKLVILVAAFTEGVRLIDNMILN